MLRDARTFDTGNEDARDGCAMRRSPLSDHNTSALWWRKEALKVIFDEDDVQSCEKKKEKKERKKGKKGRKERKKRGKRGKNSGKGKGIEEKELTKRQQRLAGDTRSGLEKRRVLFHSRSRNKGLGKL